MGGDGVSLDWQEGRPFAGMGTEREPGRIGAARAAGTLPGPQAYQRHISGLISQLISSAAVCVCERVFVCVCVCVLERERERYT